MTVVFQKESLKLLTIATERWQKKVRVHLKVDTGMRRLGVPLNLWPAFLAGMIMLPVLVIFADVIGMLGGYLVSVQILGTNPTLYIRRTWDYLEFNDLYSGLLKAIFFGMIVATISCYQGFSAQGGAEGVGRATTKAVVISSLTILISNYFITVFLF
jgi:phospholipid/cholesterol/gamma-HCH transport system permease protein